MKNGLLPLREQQCSYESKTQKMAKETVIVFDGEDKFVSKRNKKYDAKKGMANFVGSDGDVTTETTTSSTTQAPMVAVGAPMPTPDGSSDYCSRLQVYIETRGNNIATPEQIMDGHQYFLTHCNAANQTTTTSSTTSTTTVLPIGTSTTTPTTTLAPVVITPTIPIGLGLRPVGAKSGSGGGEEEKPKNKNYWWLLLVGLGVLYVFSKDNKN
jgi:hypothetical protein